MTQELQKRKMHDIVEYLISMEFMDYPLKVDHDKNLKQTDYQCTQQYYVTISHYNNDYSLQQNYLLST